MTANEDKPRKSTVLLPPDLYGDVWDIIAQEKRQGRKATMQDIIENSLREYVAKRKTEAHVA